MGGVGRGTGPVGIAAKRRVAEPDKTVSPVRAGLLEPKS